MPRNVKLWDAGPNIPDDLALARSRQERIRHGASRGDARSVRLSKWHQSRPWTTADWKDDTGCNTSDHRLLVKVKSTGVRSRKTEQEVNSYFRRLDRSSICISVIQDLLGFSWSEMDGSRSKNGAHIYHNVLQTELTCMQSAVSCREPY